MADNEGALDGLEGNIELGEKPAENAEVLGSVGEPGLIADPEGMSTLDEPVSETIVSEKMLIHL